MYMAVFFSFDGDFMDGDIRGFTIEDVLESALDVDSRPYFYPLLGIIEVEELKEAEIHGFLPNETNIVYFDLMPIGKDRYDTIVNELSKVLNLPMSISEVSREIEKIYVFYIRK